MTYDKAIARVQSFGYTVAAHREDNSAFRAYKKTEKGKTVSLIVWPKTEEFELIHDDEIVKIHIDRTAGFHSDTHFLRNETNLMNALDRLS